MLIYVNSLVYCCVLYCCVSHAHMLSVFRTNLPKEVMMFPDFPFDSHLPSFLTHWDIQRYLEQYCKSHDITPHIKVFKQRACDFYFLGIFHNHTTLYLKYLNILSNLSQL